MNIIINIIRNATKSTAAKLIALQIKFRRELNLRYLNTLIGVNKAPIYIY